MLDFMLCALTNLFRIFLIGRCVGIFLGTDADKKKKYIIYGCFYIINTVLFWEFHTIWINMICNLMGIAAIVWLHTKSVKTTLFITGTIYLVNCGCDVAATSLFINYQDGGAYNQIYAVISFFLIFICELAIEKIITIHKDTEVIQHASLVLMPICSIIVIGLLAYSETCTGIGLTIVSIGLLVVNFLMLYLYNLLLHSISQQYEMEMLKTQLQAYANQLNVILQGEEKVKALRHDIKHHLNELMLLANKHDAAEIQAYINEMKAFLQNPNEIVASGNLEIDSVLNFMLQKAQKELKTADIKVMLPEKVRHSFDINVLLGNLLENAIEAAAKTEEKYLGVHIAQKRGILKVKIENSFESSCILCEKQQGKDTVLKTTKPDTEQHGIGLKNVKKIVEKYHGAMAVTTEESMFCVNLILYMAE
ncbi:GHKL domain-containing protein [Candidatus Merdisoma sp. JLR.KK006]|uniref:sensor histidine kinase n=1 Tax=Candidatus Merdisoma sp. JLR.KK006 TaxID=3112626 RepID=UPI002FF00EFD